MAHGSLEVQLRAENSELREGFEKALQEAEALKKQNEALLKEREDTALDQYVPLRNHDTEVHRPCQSAASSWQRVWGKNVLQQLAPADDQTPTRTSVTFGNHSAYCNFWYRQMTKAMTEAEKLKAAADAYKLDLLQQKLAEREWDMQQAKERASALDQDNQGEVLQ